MNDSIINIIQGKTSVASTANGIYIRASTKVEVSGAQVEVKNLVTPVAGTDAANKDYVDGTFVSKTGDAMTGNLTVPAVNLSGSQSSAPNTVTRKDYVDGEIAKQVAKTSGIGVLKGVGNIPSDTVNGVVAPFGRSVPQTFPYSNEEEANVGQVAQNGVGVATVFAGAKVPYGGISKTKVPARGGRTGVVGKVEPVVQQKPVQANNESKQKPIGIGKQAHNINAQIALKSKLAGLEKAQSTAVKTRTLSDGRIRYYSAETPAKKEGKTRGASFVTEYNPKTGKTRQWMESYNHSGEVIRVHPKSINGQTVSGQHYPPTGTEVQKGAK